MERTLTKLKAKQSVSQQPSASSPISQPPSPPMPSSPTARPSPPPSRKSSASAGRSRLSSTSSTAVSSNSWATSSDLSRTAAHSRATPPRASLTASSSKASTLSLQREQEREQRQAASLERRKAKEEEARVERHRREEEDRLRREEERKTEAERRREAQRKKREEEVDQQRRAELRQHKMTLAAMHHTFALMRYNGWAPWRRLIAMERARREEMDAHARRSALRGRMRRWRERVAERKRAAAREEERQENRATLFHQRQLQRAAFLPWRTLALRHAEDAGTADAHYERALQQRVQRMWLDQARKRMRIKEEHLARLEERAVAVGRRRLLRFWMRRWTRFHAIREVEKRASVSAPDMRTSRNTRRDACSSSPSLVCASYQTHSEELKSDMERKAQLWLSAYRAVSVSCTVIAPTSTDDALSLTYVVLALCALCVCAANSRRAAFVQMRCLIRPQQTSEMYSFLLVPHAHCAIIIIDGQCRSGRVTATTRRRTPTP